jgi:predicted nucleic acid-binding protein
LSGAFVLDGSVALSWCFVDEKTPESAAILEQLNQTCAVVPALFPFEIANVLTQAERQGRLKPSDRDVFLETLRWLPIHIERRPLLWISQQILPLTRRFSRLTAYDAAYLEAALREGLPLANRRGAESCSRCRVGVSAADAHPPVS